MSRPLAALAAALLLCAATLSGEAASAERRSITVTAVGSAKAAPDMAQIETGVVSEQETARAALDANTAAMRQVIAALKEEGVAPEQIQTTDFSVHARYEHPKDAAPRIVGYRVVNTVRIVLYDVARLGGVLDKVVSLGANQIGGIEFSIKEPGKIEDEARRRAMAAAQAKARLLAEAAGAEIGEVISIVEETQAEPPRPRFERSVLAAKATDVPIEAGEHSVRVSVRVVWELE